jgi:hypothetical protein
MWTTPSTEVSAGDDVNRLLKPILEDEEKEEKERTMTDTTTTRDE